MERLQLTLGRILWKTLCGGLTNGTAILTVLVFVAALGGANARATGAQETPRGLLALETGQGIHFINVDGRGMRRMPGTRPGDQSPDWSPDGRRLVFWYERGGRGDIYVANADGSGRRRLTGNPHRSHEYPTWSPDGRWIAFEVGHAGIWHVFVMRPDGSGLRRITPDGYGGLAPRWSPNSRELVYGAAWYGTGLAIISLRGSRPRPLPTKTDFDWAPSWSPDGRTIAFNTEAHGKSEVYSVDIPSARLTRLTQNNAQDFDPAWSPDNRYIVFTTGRDGNNEVYVMRNDGTNQKRVTRIPRGNACCAAWRP